MKKTELYTEGARLPEQLSRLIFLEGMIEGRRVLEVGAQSSAVARFLLEQGASRVVCAIDDRALLDQLRDENDIDKIDYRAVRPAGGSRPPGLAQAPVLPGDDGAFDLVIDFTLPEALAAGITERLTDIKRLLSVDGFAITALPSSPRGLGLLLEPATAPAPARVGYRTLADALRGSFELAQVYFQSLMLGYLFGSFDIEGGDDGIAPQTALMGDDAEPAGAYLFAFGNAIPVIEDVCLVQVPFDTLLEAVLARRDHNDNDAIDTGMLQQRDDRIAALELELQAARPYVEDDVGIVVTELARRLDDAVARALGFEHDVGVREVELVRALAIRDELRCERDALAEQLVAVDGERGALARRSSALEEELLLTSLRVVELEDGGIAADAQRSALQLELIELHTWREHQQLRHNAERELLEAAIAESNTVANELQTALTDVLGIVVAPMQRSASNDSDSEPDGLAARVRASLRERFAVVEDRAARAEALAAELAEQLSAVEYDLEEARSIIDERVADVDAATDRALEAASDDAVYSQTAIAALQQALDDAISARAAADDVLARRTDEATRLAAAVEALVAERARWRQQHDSRRVADTAALTAALDEARRDVAAHTTRADSNAAAATELRLALDEVRVAFDAANDAAKQEQQRLLGQHAEVKTQLEQRRAHDQRQLEEVRRQLEAARDTTFELTAQRDVLQQALGGRERELAAVGADIDGARTTIEQLTGEIAAIRREHSDVQRAAEALSLEVRRLNAVIDDEVARAATLKQEHAQLQQRVDTAEAARVAAEDETLKLMLLVEEVEAAGTTAREQWRLEHDQAHAAALAAVDATLQTTQHSLREAEAALARTLDAARTAGDDAARTSTEFDAERRSHSATRDELAQLTAAILELEETIARQRAEAEATHVAATAAAVDEAVAAAVESTQQRNDTRHGHERERWQHEQQALQELIDEAATTQATLRTELTTICAARDDDRRALVQLQLACDEQRGERAVIEATLAEATGILVERTNELEALQARHSSLGLEHEKRADESRTLAATLASLRSDHATATTTWQAALSAQQAEHGTTATTLSASVSTLQAQLQEQTAATKAAEDEWLRADEALTTAQATLSATSMALSTLQAAHDELVAAHAVLQQQAFEADKRSEQLQQRLEITTTQLQEVDDEAQLAAERAWQRASEQDRAIADLRAALDDASATHASALEALRQEHVAADAVSGSTHAELTAQLQARTAHEAQLEAQLAAARLDVDSAAGEVARLTEVLAIAEATSLATQRQRDDEQSTLRHELELVRAQFTDARAAEAALRQHADADSATHIDAVARLNALHETSIVAARTALAAAEAHANETLALVVNDHDSAVATLRSELADVIAGAVELSRNLEAARAEGRDALAQQAEHHDDALAALQQALAAAEARAADVAAELTARLAASEQQRADDRDESAVVVAAHRKALEEARAASAAATVRVGELERALDDAIQQYTDEAEQKEALEAEHKTLQSRLDDAEQRAHQQRQVDLEAIASLTSTRDAALAARATADDALDAVRVGADELQERFDAALREHADVDAARVAVVAAVATLEAEQHQLREALAGAVEDGAARQAEADRLAAAHTAMSTTLADLEQHRDRASHRGDLFAAELEEAVTRLSLERARGDLLQATLNEARTAADAIRAEFAAVRAEHDDERRELTETTAQLSADADTERLRADDAQREVGALKRAAQDVEAEHARALTDQRERLESAAGADVEDRVDAAVEAAVAAAQIAAETAVRAANDNVASSEAACTHERARVAVLEGTLDKARAIADTLGARAELLAATLQEVRDHAERERARAELLTATLAEARDHADRERARAELLTATLQEARDHTEHQRELVKQHHDEQTAAITAAITAKLSADHAADLEDAHAVAALAHRRATAEATAAQTEIAALRAELAAATSPTPSSIAVADDDLVARLRTELGELQVRNESRTVELAGLRDALLTAREDGRDLEELVNAHESRAEALAMALAQQEQAVLAAQQAHRDLLDDSEVANAQRDAALAEIEMVEASAKDEQEQRRALEDELAQVRLELERQLAHGPGRAPVVDGAEFALLREKLEAAERHLRLRDEKIAEQAERINRLTERIVRNER